EEKELTDKTAKLNREGLELYEPGKPKYAGEKVAETPEIPPKHDASARSPAADCSLATRPNTSVYIELLNSEEVKLNLAPIKHLIGSLIRPVLRALELCFCIALLIKC